MNLLLHMCCGPCTTYGLDYFQKQGYKVQGFYFNPNIHPYSEYLRRRETLRQFCLEKEIGLHLQEEYQPEQYFASVLPELSSRCRACYLLRLDETAAFASRLGIETFATTLTVSPYQNQTQLRQSGEKAEEKHKVRFVNADLRDGYRESVQLSQHKGMYRQNYCGCIFSEKERHIARQQKRRGK